MREILFRGKLIDSDKWLYGIPIKTHIGIFICYEENPHYCSQYLYMEINEIAKVIPETVGQFTGLTDKNGKKIFEGDIVRYETIAHNGYEGIYKVVFEDRNGCGYFGITYSDIETRAFCYSVPASQMEIIGNIHDNPELLGENKDER